MFSHKRHSNMSKMLIDATGGQTQSGSHHMNLTPRKSELFQLLKDHWCIPVFLQCLG